MSLEKPFKSDGLCITCKFSEPIPIGHHQSKYHALFCRRFPPTGPQKSPGSGPWNVDVPVMLTDYCAEWKSDT